MNQLRIHAHMEVIGADGVHVGTVDQVDGERIKLARPSLGGQRHYHYIPLAWVAHAEGIVELRKTAEEARREWLSEREVAG